MLSGTRALAQCLPPRALRSHQHRQRRVPCRAREDAIEGVGSNTGAYCSLDATGKKLADKTLMEKENEFLEVRCKLCCAALGLVTVM
jgi:hypothetical protein